MSESMEEDSSEQEYSVDGDGNERLSDDSIYKLGSKVRKSELKKQNKDSRNSPANLHNTQ